MVSVFWVPRGQILGGQSKYPSLTFGKTLPKSGAKLVLGFLALGSETVCTEA